MNRLDFPPGAQFQYSNSGYFLLGMIIEAVTGQTYGEYVQQALTRPIGLQNTIYCPNRPAEEHAHGFRPSPSGPVVAIPLSMTHVFYAAGSLCSTAVDLVKWAHALASGQVVSATSYRQMVTPGVLVGGDAVAYGYGLVPDELFGVKSIAHAGGQIGFSAALAYYPESEIAVTALANYEAANTADVVNRLSRVMLELEEPTVRDLVMTAAERERYTGGYGIGATKIRVLEDGERLVMQGLGATPMRLMAQGNHEFRARLDPSVRVVFRVEKERARLLTLHRFGQCC